METIGARMRRKRVEQNLSLKAVAQRAGIPLSTYREWEAGRQIKGEPYEKIAYALDVSLYWLITGKSRNPREVLGKVGEIEAACVAIRNSLESLI